MAPLYNLAGCRASFRWLAVFSVPLCQSHLLSRRQRAGAAEEASSLLSGRGAKGPGSRSCLPSLRNPALWEQARSPRGARVRRKTTSSNFTHGQEEFLSVVVLALALVSTVNLASVRGDQDREVGPSASKSPAGTCEQAGCDREPFPPQQRGQGLSGPQRFNTFPQP